ncbi:MAG: phosphate ABC transporter permease PstA [candidate division WS1 bacterium]|nr:phosphate ABC transporter permease PstA [candidate division WS1 bacterium]
MLLALAPVLFIILTMLVKGLPGLSWSFLTSHEAGMLPSIVGTVLLVLLTGLITTPLGVAAAIYLSEYARPGPVSRLIRLAILNLAGVPSVVYGLFGLALFVTWLHMGRSLLAGACTLALLVLPLIISASEEALRQLPRGLREGSLALGATRLQTIRRVVLPNALPGILTGLILALGRAAGETAPILFTAAFFSLTDPFPSKLTDPIMALPYQIYVMATEIPNLPPEQKWAGALVLLVVTLGLNLGAIVIRARLRKKTRW